MNKTNLNNDFKLKNKMTGQAVETLLVWYYKNKRQLPWRDQNNPYYTWISEIMLQQTRVEAVKGYFTRFIKELPDVESLACVDDEKLMKLWEGLGYYNRARNLKKAAVEMIQQYDGKVPKGYNLLIELSGIGPYTAGAVASIAFGEAVPAVDGNVLRVVMRLLGSYEDITQNKVKRSLEEQIRRIMPKKHAGDFNQALMELGAIVCLPNGKPLCEECPLQDICMAKQKGIQMELPVKPVKKKRKIEEKTVFILKYQGRIALAKRPKDGVLADMWEFPNVQGKMEWEQVSGLLSEYGIEVQKIEKVEEKKHIFTHLEWHMRGFYVVCESIPDNTKFQWVNERERAEKYALPTAMSQFAE